MVGRIMGAVLVLLTAGCGDDRDDSAGAAGSAGSAPSSGGAAGTAGSGGAAGIGNVTRGAFSMHIVPGEGCSLPEQWVDFPVVVGGHPVTATETVQTIDDGATEQVTNSSGSTFDTTVSRLTCTWGSRDPAYDLHVGFRFGPASNEGTLSMSAGITVGESRGLGILIVGQDWDEKNYGGQCTYTALEVDDATRSVRGEVTCPVLERVTDDPDAQPPETCSLPIGYYAFENCELP